jgi:hypothetical protein
MFESDITLRENDSGLKKSLEIRKKEITDAIGLYTTTAKLAENIEVPINSGTEVVQTIRLNTLPLIMQQFAINMRPNIIQNATINEVEFYATTTESNIIYTNTGFVAEVPLFHREAFILAAEAKANMTMNSFHKRPITGADRSEASLASLADSASRAYPKPLETWGNLLSGKEFCI